MADPSFRLERIITLPTGSLLQYGNGSRESLYFYDANHNLKLDSGDKKVTERPLERNRFEFGVSKINQTAIQQFGKEAEAVLSQARQERNELRKTLPSAKAGQCFAPSQGGHDALIVQDSEFSFRPSLDLRTGRADPERFYSFIELMGRSSPVDPSRCFMARALVTREKISGSLVSSKQIEVAAGDLLTPLALGALGLENGDRQDAAYQIVQGAKRLHIDLTP